MHCVFATRRFVSHTSAFVFYWCFFSLCNSRGLLSTGLTPELQLGFSQKTSLNAHVAHAKAPPWHIRRKHPICIFYIPENVWDGIALFHSVAARLRQARPGFPPAARSAGKHLLYLDRHVFHNPGHKQTWPHARIIAHLFFSTSTPLSSPVSAIAKLATIPADLASCQFASGGHTSHRSRE